MVRIDLGWILLLFGTMTCATSEAGDWVDQRTVGRFQLRANFVLDEFPQMIAELKRLESDVNAALGIGTVDDPIHLLLFRDKTTYQQYLHRYFPGAPARRALFIKGTGPGWVFAYQNPQFEIDVRHESTHALLHSKLPMVPLWLDEGLADYFEVAAEQRVYDNPHLSPTKWSARFYRVRALRQLEDLDDVRQMGTSEYRAAWAWIHFMLHGPREAQQVLLDYVADIRNNIPPGRLSERLELAVPDVERQYLRHFRNWHR